MQHDNTHQITDKGTCIECETDRKIWELVDKGELDTDMLTWSQELKQSFLIELGIAQAAYDKQNQPK